MPQILPKKHAFNQRIARLCQPLGIACQPLSEDWILKLTHQNQTRYLINGQFNLNPDATTQLADDKAATATILAHHQLPVVPHQLLFNPKRYPLYSSWEKIEKLLSTATLPLVLKPNIGGSQGTDVTLCRTTKQAFSTAKRLFKKYRSLSLCPYLPSPYEYRCFYLNGHILYIYQKTRPKRAWKHNLSLGATATLLSTNNPLFSQLETLALAAGQALTINFATIDILATQDGFKILEINARVTTSVFATQVPDGSNLADDIYRQALKVLFNLAPQA
ncbi:MAG: hypothetical protein Q4A30_01660 [Candidatus Saccharibacteria bacterium]|nr:hypothetical protein [Candidatus Saccharibacteria bacterium]